MNPYGVAQSKGPRAQLKDGVEPPGTHTISLGIEL